MADEAAISLSLSYTKNGITLSKSFDFNVTVSGNYPIENVQNIGTSDESLAIGDVGGTPGWLFIKNLDPTNYVLIGGDGTNYFDRLKPGEAMIKRFNGSAIHAKANTAACDVEYLLLPD